VIMKVDKIETIANVLHKLGRKREVVMNGSDYIDEVSLAGDNHLVLLNEGTISSFTVHPHDLGLPVYENKEIQGGPAKENAAILHSVLNNEASPYLDTVLLNAAIGLFAHGKVHTLIDGIEMARDSIASGKAMDRLNTLVEYSQSVSKEAI